MVNSQREPAAAQPSNCQELLAPSALEAVEIHRPDGSPETNNPKPFSASPKRNNL
jgi:hypothetical protein